MLTIAKNHHKSEHGFTLIELLVVIMIMGILSAIAIPVFLNQRMTAIASTILPVVNAVEEWSVKNPNKPLLGNSDFANGTEFASLISSANKNIAFSESPYEDSVYKLKTFGSHGENYELCFQRSNTYSNRSLVYVYDSKTGKVDEATSSQC